LYDIESDPGERVDLSTKHPEIYADLLRHWEEYANETNTLWSPIGTKRTMPEGMTLEDSIGGDPIEQCTAWMHVGEGEVARPTLPHYNLAA
jgi:hypothetical protein